MINSRNSLKRAGWAFAIAAAVLALVLAGCSESENAPAAPESLATAKPGPEAEYDGGNLDGKVVFVHSYEAFDALTGEVQMRDFSHLPVPGSSCCDDCEAEGQIEIRWWHVLLDFITISSPTCLRTEDRGRTVMILDPPGRVQFSVLLQQNVLFEYSGNLEGIVVLKDGNEVGFSTSAGIDEVAYFGIVTTIDMYSVLFTQPAILYSVSSDPRIEALEDSVISNIKLIVRGFEYFAELSGGEYPILATYSTPYGDTLEDLLPGGRYPINPFDGQPTSFGWAQGAAASAGACAVTTSGLNHYVIEGRGADPAAPYIYTAVSPPFATQMIRNLRIVQTGLEAFAMENEGSYPTSSSDATPDGDTLVQFLPWERPPLNPYIEGIRQDSPISWNADADTISGAIAILIARPDFYMLRARGDDPHGYIDTYLIPEGCRSWAERE